MKIFCPNYIYAILFSLILVISACDCVQKASGVVLDSSINKPIDSVSVHKDGSDSEEFSDSSGHFEIRAISGGLFGCPVLKLSFVKNGYRTISNEYDNSSNNKVYLERLK